MVVVGYTRVNSDGITENVVHQEYSTKQEAAEAAEALATALIEDTTAVCVLRGFKKHDDVVDYNVIYEIPR